MSDNQLQLPYEPIIEVANRDFLRKNFSRSNREVYKIPLSNIEVRPGFNKRSVYEGIEELADSIKQHGLKEPLTVDVLTNGRVLLEKGHRRLKAIQLLVERGEVFDEVECNINPRTTTELQRMQDIYTSNMHSCQLTAYEQSCVVFDLKNNFGKTSNEEIADKLGISRQKVDMLLMIAEAPAEIKELIKNGSLGITEAVATIRKNRKVEKQGDKVEEDSHKTSLTPTPEPKDELTDELKELEKLNEPTEEEMWWSELKQEVQASYAREYFGDEVSSLHDLTKEQIETIYEGVQAEEQLKELLEISDEIKVREDTLQQHIGRKLSADVSVKWVDEYFDDDSNPHSRERVETLFEKNAILTEEAAKQITETGDIDTIFVYKHGMEPVAPSVITEPVAEKEKGKYDESREEIGWCQNAIKNLDWISVQSEKLPDQMSKDFVQRCGWIMKDLELIRDWISKNKKQNKAR